MEVKELKRMALIMLFCIAILLAGCVEVETITPEKVENTSGVSTEPQQKIEVFKIGDSVKAENLIFTVNSTRTDQGSEFIKPDDGNIYYIVDVTIENVGDESEAVSSLMMFKLFDSEGYNYSITIGPETKGSVDGEISAGRKLRGELAFEVPEDAKGLELVIEPSLLSSGQIIVELDR
jgi:hypothetical protein